MNLQNEKLIIITSDDHDEDCVVAVFDSPALAKDFLNRPLAKGRKYVVSECSVNPSFYYGADNIYSVIYDPNSDKHWSIEQIYAFDDEIDAMKSKWRVYDGRFFVTLFGKTEEEAKMQVLAMYESLVKTGVWDELDKADDDNDDFIDPYLKYKNWKAPVV